MFWHVSIMIHICLRQPRQVVQTEPTRKVEKKKKKKGRLGTTNANRLQITVNLKKIHHLRRAFRRFCASSHPSYKCFMLENLAFFHNSSKTPDKADIANRKHYSAPAGALTMFSPLTFGKLRTKNFPLRRRRVWSSEVPRTKSKNARHFKGGGLGCPFLWVNVMCIYIYMCIIFIYILVIIYIIYFLICIMYNMNEVWLYYYYLKHK